MVSTDDGVEGFGEISMIWDGNGFLQCHFVNEVFRPALLGEDPTAINRCLRRLDTRIERGWPARAAVEMALFDVAGKALNTPVYNLLGGRSRESIVLSHSIAIDAPVEMARAAARYVAESGGLTNASLIFRMAEAVGVPCLIGAMPELGIGTAAAVHLGVAMTNLNDPCDACGVIYHVAEITNERLEVREGRIWPPTGPGLGVTLDRQALERYRAA